LDHAEQAQALSEALAVHETVSVDPGLKLLGEPQELFLREIVVRRVVFRGIY
jgi:hypothetical protein